MDKRIDMTVLAIVGIVLIIGLVLLFKGGITGAASVKSTCSGGMAITDGSGQYCYMSTGSCSASCEVCETKVKVVDTKTFLKRCSSGR